MSTAGLTKQELQIRARVDYGVGVTAHMIERYERSRFIHTPTLVSGGYKSGVRGVYPVEDLRTVAALPVVLPYCHRSLDLAAVGVWALHDCPVPWQTVKKTVERMLMDARDAASRSPDRATRALLSGWVGKTAIRGSGARRHARARALVAETLGQAPASTMLATLETMMRTLGGDPSLVAGSLTTYDAAAGGYTTIPDRSSIPPVLESVRRATEGDARVVRPMVLWVIVWVWNIQSALLRPHPPKTRAARAFAYGEAPLAVALLLHIKTIMPSAEWQTFSVNLSAMLRPYLPVDAEVMLRKYPFRQATHRKRET